MTDRDIQNMQEILAHQEKQIHELNDVVTRQWDEIDMLKKRLNRMQDKIQILEDHSSSDDKPLSVSDEAARNKPPHY